MNPLNNPTAQVVDQTLIYIFGFSLLLLLGITVVTIYFVIKYRRSKYPEPTSDAHSNWIIETIWTIVPIIIVLTMFWYGWSNYIGLTSVPDDALEIKATARMWSWQFEYPNGRRTNKIYVPVGKPVKINLTSVDVLHSFFAPAFRIKKDTVPGMTTYVWFTAPEAGSYDVQCTEYCGVGHADMLTTIEALDEDAYAKWLKGDEKKTAEPAGLIVINEQGCTGCHSLDGSDNIGPSLFELAGARRQIDRNGQTIEITIDETYLKKAVREPDAEIVNGYDAMMPPYDESIISNEDLQALVDYLLGQTVVSEPALDGVQLIEDNGCFSCHSNDGSDSIGPSFQGIGSRDVTIERDGQKVIIKVDADYLRRALITPEADMVKDYPPMMPAADYLSPEEIDAMIKYLLKQ